MPADQNELTPPTSEAAALVRLGLKVAFGARGEHVVEYLDEARIRRAARRLESLGEHSAEEGLDPEALLRRIEDDDDAAEFFQQVAEDAAQSRYEAKIRFLAKCLANAMRTKDSAVPDMEWARIAAMRDIDAVHVRLLHLLEVEQRLPIHPPARASLAGHQLPAVSRRALVQSERRPDGFPNHAFDPVMAVLVRAGLVALSQSIDLDVDIDLDVEEGSATANPEVDSRTMYELTLLGGEVLDSVENLASDTEI